MKISSLKDLLFAKVLKQASISSVDEFYIQDGKDIKQNAFAFAYFAKDINGVKNALDRSAYVIIVDFDVDIEGEAWCLRVDDISVALKRLVSFIAKDKTFYLCSKIQENFAKKLGINVLINEIFNDFENILKNDIFLSSDKEYLSSISSFLLVPKYDYEIIHSSNFFHTSFKIKDIDLFYTDLFGVIKDVYLSDVVLPKELVGEFCGLYYLAKKTATMIDFYFLDKNGALADSFHTQKCVILLDNDFDEYKKIFTDKNKFYFTKNYDEIMSNKCDFVFLKMQREEFLNRVLNSRKNSCLF